MQTRYHIQLNNRRTTITVDTILSSMLAIKLGEVPESPEAHGTVRKWLEDTINDRLGKNLPSGSRVSQWARVFAIEAIAKKKLLSSYQDWMIEKDKTNQETI